MTVTETKVSTKTKRASKRQMLSFALPALGIYLANPLLSNIDNSFVGKTVGTQGLAALSPATICTDQVLYLFSFLSRATTGLVSRAYGSKKNEEEKREAAAQAASAPLTVSLIAGFLISIAYVFLTPTLLSILNVTPSLRPSATSYILWRGAIAWAALAQSVSLSVMMATRDAITPLKIIGMAAGVNVVGDYLLCVWPLRWGVSGAAAATSFATLFSSFFMIKALRRKSILPKVRLPTRKEIMGLTEFTGPLLAITITRLIGFVNMQRTAMGFGVKETAAYQLSINLVIFFLLFAEPLSQLSQTQLPGLVDANNGPEVRANLKSVLILGALTALGIGSVAGLTVAFGSSLFSSDLAVQTLSKQAAPSVFMTVATAIFAGMIGEKYCMCALSHGAYLAHIIRRFFNIVSFSHRRWCHARQSGFRFYAHARDDDDAPSVISAAIGLVLNNIRRLWNLYHPIGILRRQFIDLGWFGPWKAWTGSARWYSHRRSCCQWFGHNQTVKKCRNLIVCIKILPMGWNAQRHGSINQRSS
jgi:Na+-driven multidrug efflux pump